MSCQISYDEEIFPCLFLPFSQMGVEVVIVQRTMAGQCHGLYSYETTWSPAYSVYHIIDSKLWVGRVLSSMYLVS